MKAVAADGDEDEGRGGIRRRKRRSQRCKEMKAKVKAVVRGEKERRWWFW